MLSQTETALGSSRRTGKRTKRQRQPNEISNISNLLINIFFWIYTAICVVPLILVVIVSFSDENSVIQNGYSFFLTSGIFLLMNFC